MTTELSKGKRILFFIAVMLSNIAVMGDNVLYPITMSIYGAFPDSLAGVNYILSGPPLLIVVASLIAPLILIKMSKRNLMIIGSVLFTFGAVFGVAVQSVGWMAFTRSLVGVGQGFINVCAIALIADVYVEEKLRARFVGFFNASMNAIGIILMYVSGVVGVSDWTNSFKLYYASIAMLVMVILFIPKLSSDTPTGRALKAEETAQADKNKKMGGEFWELIITFFIAATLSMVVAYFMSVYVTENNIGDATLTGTAGSIGQLCSFFGAMAFGFIYNKMKRFTLTMGYVLIVAAYVLWLLVMNPGSVIAVYVIETLAYIFEFSYAYAHASLIVPTSKINLAVAIVTAAYGIASFVSTYFVTFLMGAMNTNGSFTPVILPLLIIGIVILVIDIICAVIRTAKNKRLAEAQ